MGVLVEAWYFAPVDRQEGGQEKRQHNAGRWQAATQRRNVERLWQGTAHCIGLIASIEVRVALTAELGGVAVVSESWPVGRISPAWHWFAAACSTKGIKVRHRRLHCEDVH